MTRTVDVDERTSQFDSSRTMDLPTSAAHRRAKVRTFVFAFGIAFTLLYTILERLNWPLFTWQPAVGKMYFWLHRPLSSQRCLPRRRSCSALALERASSRTSMAWPRSWSGSISEV